jgi:hypothetical protein
MLEPVPKVCVAKKRFFHVAMLCVAGINQQMQFCHYLGLVFSLARLQTVTLYQAPPEDVIHSKSN